MTPRSSHPPFPWPLIYVTLGTLWWIALLVPEISRLELMGGPSIDWIDFDGPVQKPDASLASLSWGFARVLAIVAAACSVFRRLHHALPRLRWLIATFCCWFGSSLYAATIWRRGVGDVLFLVALGPPVFFALAYYVILPMVVLTVWVLRWAERANFKPRLEERTGPRYSATPSRSAAGRSRTVLSKDS